MATKIHLGIYTNMNSANQRAIKTYGINKTGKSFGAGCGTIAPASPQVS